MSIQNKIYGVKFSSPPKNYEVINLLTKFLKEKQNVADLIELERKHNEIIEQDLQSWNLVDVIEFRKIYAQEKIRMSEKLAELKDNIAENGWGIKQWFGLFNLVVIVCCAIFIGYKYFSGKEQRELKQQARNEFYGEIRRSQELVEAHLKDPNSAEFKDQIYNCGWVNAKNGFGAYMGFKRYVVVLEQVFLEGANADPDSMTKLWNEACKK